MGRLVFALASLLLVSCDRVPEGGRFERTRAPMPLGLFLSDQRLELPWTPLSFAGKHSWCFANLSFSGSQAWVVLEVSARTPFDPRHVGGQASVEVTDSSGRVAFHASGELKDPCCGASSGTWASQYFHYSKSPDRDSKVFYEREPGMKAKIGSFGEYCVALNVSAPPTTTESANARVVMISGWK